MRLTPDEVIFWQYGLITLNATIVFTWGLMLVLVVGSILITRNLSATHKRSRWQNLLEIVVTGIEKQIEEAGLRQPQKYIGFLGTLFFIPGRSQSLYCHPGLRATDGISFDYGCTRHMRVCCCTAVRN